MNGGRVMMVNISSCLGAGVIWGLLLLSHMALGVEPPVRDALVFWLDAAGQPAARERAGLPPIQRFQPVDLLVDSSEGARIAVQMLPEHRPSFVSDGETAYLNFDGKNDFIFFDGPREPVHAVTIFVLAAPKSNPGNFSGMLGMAEPAKNDYTSGLNLDFGPVATEDLSVLNVEAAGASGFRDMLVPGFLNAAERPFGDFHVFTVRSKPGKGGTQVFLDGFKGGERDRSESTLGIAQIVVGGRIYSNDPMQPSYAQGFFNGAIAEVLVYARALADDERQAVEQALLGKTVALHALLSGAKGHALETVKDPPAVQMLVPGFTVHELPVKLRNLNNVRYRHDGKLVGLGYDGRIHLLTDTDGDGLEDSAQVFWDQPTLRGPIGMALTPKDDPRGDGIFITSKGKLSFIVDKDRDGRADEEIVAATGWPQSFHSVDTLGVAIHPKDGSIYFGLGCANFVDAYLTDKATGRSHYKLHDIRGTIQRLSADFSIQETVCTGVRFTCALAFNRDGELFATDQEGATWLPNGNPLDELLHIERGKHYGFPPRHPKHLPDVIDEPAVIEFGPQHQSTVGMIFNEGVNGGPAFGPAHWEGDALVCGAARGKIWRTKLAKTPLGYVAQNHLIACLSLIAVDACVSPEGDLVVVCHSGPPDWGTGPAGEGRIFKIRYTDRELPQPVLAWAAAPDEFRIAFDRPLDPAEWAGAKDAVKVEAGAHVRAGDRFEVIRPGYQVVRDQMSTPRRWVEVMGLTLSEDRRTLALRVARQTEPVTYAITMPQPASWRRHPAGMPQHAEMDLAVALNGVAAVVTSPSGHQLRTVLPHPSLNASKVLTRGSAEHERFLEAATAANAVLKISGAVDLRNPFVPQVQPGSKLDWNMAQDAFASAVFGVRTDDGRDADLLVDGNSERRTALLSVVTTNPPAAANGWYLTHSKYRQRTSTDRIYLPWATNGADTEPSAIMARSNLPGDWKRGRDLFFGAASCSTCHTVREEGIAFGPDLSNLIHRDRESVLQDIVRPSAAINPDQTGTEIQLNDGTAISGIVRSMDAHKIVLAMPAGAQMEIERDLVVGIEPLKSSLMPEGLGDALTKEQLEDLLKFLLTEPDDSAESNGDHGTGTTR